MQHICQQTMGRIQDAIGGNFEFISFATFIASGELRTRYTIRRPKGKNFYHLIGYENGDIRLISKDR